VRRAVEAARREAGVAAERLDEGDPLACGLVRGQHQVDALERGHGHGLALASGWPAAIPASTGSRRTTPPCLHSERDARHNRTLSLAANASYQCTPRIRCASATASVEAFGSGCFSVS
jgi:hypothetical protein